MVKVTFELRKVSDNNGQQVDTLFKKTTEDNGDFTEEAWGTVIDYDRLFAACVDR